MFLIVKFSLFTVNCVVRQFSHNYNSYFSTKQWYLQVLTNPYSVYDKHPLVITNGICHFRNELEIARAELQFAKTSGTVAQLREKEMANTRQTGTSPATIAETTVTAGCI